MRRTTPGVAAADDLVDPRLSRAEGHDPAQIVAVLEPLVTAARRARLHEVLGRRIESVAVILDRPYDPHNGAAVVRSCEAFGVQALHVVEQATVPFAVARSVSRGAEKWVDVTRHKRADTALGWARERGMKLVATHPDGELEPAALATIPRLALVLGNEQQGIHEEIEQVCSARVRVPMRGFVESLNVSVTAALLLYAATLGRPGDLRDSERLRLYARGLYLSVPHAEDLLAHDALHR